MQSLDPASELSVEPELQLKACKAQNVFDNSFVAAKMSAVTTADLPTKMPGSRQDVGGPGSDARCVHLMGPPQPYTRLGHFQRLPQRPAVNRPPADRLVSERTPLLTAGTHFFVLLLSYSCCFDKYEHLRQFDLQTETRRPAQ